MFDWRSMLVSESHTILEAMAVIDRAGAHAALIVGPDDFLRGIVTDGDIRRGILKNIQLDEPIATIMNTKPFTAAMGESEEKLLQLMKSRSMMQIPIVDASNRVVDVKVMDQVIKGRRHGNPVVLMAGGLGKRLYPLTKETPKPLLKIGEKPILEIILETFLSQGFYNFYISVGFKAEMIEDYFGDGSKWDCEIHYLREEAQTGTAGSLANLPAGLHGPFIVMNGDLLTKTNFEQMLDFHRAENALATMGVREYDFQVPYGVVQINDGRITGMDEKPVHSFFVSGGIYVLSREAVLRIPQGTPYDMPQLFQALMDDGRHTAAFPLRDYWLDVGRHDDFTRAARDYKDHFGK